MSKYKATINAGGHIEELVSSESDCIRFRDDEFAGPAWVYDGEIVPTSCVDTDESLYRAQLNDLHFSLQYDESDYGVVVQASIRNDSTSPRTHIRAGIQLGVDTYMESFPEWNDRVFPTLLRCEKTHFWGYFMGPKGQILLVTTSEPVASYSLQYKPGKHRIYTATLDVMTPLPVPQRHPQGLHTLQPGEEKRWTLKVKTVATLTDIKPAVAMASGAPMIDIDLYTIAQGEAFKGQIASGPSGLTKLTVCDPKGTIASVPFQCGEDENYLFSYSPKGTPGAYKLTAVSENGKQSEAMLAVRHPWSWYLKMARKNAVVQEQKASSHTESWYGLFSAYLARKHFPDAELDSAIEKRFDEIWPLMFDRDKMEPLTHKKRIQNSACAIGVLVDKYQAAGNIADLEFAAGIADYILSTQKESGGYYNGNTHYTCVIYIAKSIMELIEDEKALGQTEAIWKDRADRHLASVKQAIDDLERSRDDIQTEGEMTYEDGMIGCSYTQISMYALYYAKPEERQKYIDAALYLLKGHRCLSQLLIPDCRMNGGSLRFWESQYDILTTPNMMNSPHGWSGWRVYGLWYLYQLTGNEDYLKQVFNAMGSCCQLIDFDSGELRWAFVPDPCIKADYWEEDPASPGRGRAVDKVIGEQYLPMISHWYKAAHNTNVFAYGREQDGGACDNDVHEVFKCLEETVLTSAYVVEHDDGTLACYNCSGTDTDGTLRISLHESQIHAVHLNLKSSRTVFIQVEESESLEHRASAGLSWVESSDNGGGTKRRFEETERSGSIAPEGAH